MADAPGPQTRHPELPAAAPRVPQLTSSQVCSRGIAHVAAGAGEAGDGGQRGPQALPLRQEDGVEAPTTLRRAATSQPANARPAARPREDTPDAQRGDASASSARTGRRPGTAAPASPSLKPHCTRWRRTATSAPACGPSPKRWRRIRRGRETAGHRCLQVLADAQAQDNVIGLVRAASRDRDAATRIRVLLAEDILTSP